jgi:23S rRNA (cytidine2498-2'-O)-methyltransferase
MTVDLLERPFACYLAPPGLEGRVAEELGAIESALGRLFIKRGPAQDCAWAQNVWLDPRVVAYDSIADAARKLRAIQRNWAPYSISLHRRTALIAQALPPLPSKAKRFPFLLPSAPMGAFALIDETRLIASPSCSSPFPGGEIDLEEDKLNPPSRAYLKLEEALTLMGSLPAPGQLCLDAGASPGGWTWVLRKLGARVIAVDRSELAPALMSDASVEFRRGSAFSLRPAAFGRVDWILSDVICYPPRLLEWIREWLESGLCGNFVCTLKMQGSPDWKSIRAFQALPGGLLRHLSNNKNELTWMRPAGPKSGL